MTTHSAPDTKINYYLLSLRESMRVAIGYCAADWEQAWQDKFYEILNSTDEAKYRLGMVMGLVQGFVMLGFSSPMTNYFVGDHHTALSTLKALTGTQVHLQDVLEQLE